jgi:hypothetical protein
MNERIKELAKQASAASVIDGMDGRFYVISPAMEKFAELIVRECANVGSKSMYPDSDPDYVGRNIREHFGVE